MSEKVEQNPEKIETPATSRISDECSTGEAHLVPDVAALVATRLAIRETVGRIIEAVGVLQAHQAVIDWELARIKQGNTSSPQDLSYSKDDIKRLRHACSALDFLKVRSQECTKVAASDVPSVAASEPRKAKRGRPIGSKNQAKIARPDNKPSTIVSTPTVFFHQEPSAPLSYNLNMAKKLKKKEAAEHNWRENRPHLEALPNFDSQKQHHFEVGHLNLSGPSMVSNEAGGPPMLQFGSSSAARKMVHRGSFSMMEGGVTSTSYPIQAGYGINPHNLVLDPALQCANTGYTGDNLNIADLMRSDPRFQLANSEGGLPRTPAVGANPYNTGLQYTSAGSAYGNDFQMNIDPQGCLENSGFQQGGELMFRDRHDAAAWNEGTLGGCTSSTSHFGSAAGIAEDGFY